VVSIKELNHSLYLPFYMIFKLYKSNRFYNSSSEKLKERKATIYIDSKAVADGRVEKTQPNIFSGDETADVGLDNQTPVAEGIGYGPEETRFKGKINKVFVATWQWNDFVLVKYM
jgi:hypothetical protein